MGAVHHQVRSQVRAHTKTHRMITFSHSTVPNSRFTTRKTIPNQQFLKGHLLLAKSIENVSGRGHRSHTKAGKGTLARTKS